LEFELSLMLTTYASGTAKQSMGKWRDRSNLLPHRRSARDRKRSALWLT
jgi:hypothetical protein